MQKAQYNTHAHHTHTTHTPHHTTHPKHTTHTHHTPHAHHKQSLKITNKYCYLINSFSRQSEINCTAGKQHKRPTHSHRSHTHTDHIHTQSRSVTSVQVIRSTLLSKSLNSCSTLHALVYKTWCKLLVQVSHMPIDF